MNTDELKWEFREARQTLSNIGFTTKLTPEEEALADRFTADNWSGDPVNRPSGVYLLAGTWFIKLYLGGEQRTFATRSDWDHISALRLADMLKLHFWPWRQRCVASAPRNEDFNISLTRAKSDLETETEIKLEFIHIQNILINRGALDADPATARDNNVLVKARRTTVGKKFDDRIDAVLAAIRTLDAKLDALAARLPVTYGTVYEQQDNQPQPPIEETPNTATMS